ALTALPAVLDIINIDSNRIARGVNRAKDIRKAAGGSQFGRKILSTGVRSSVNSCNRSAFSLDVTHCLLKPEPGYRVAETCHLVLPILGVGLVSDGLFPIKLFGDIVRET
ncbi:MAG: hypothetical protein ROO76_14370, partial [Terriglobia bacterium]|nr:hypothetical protein [Terriglobia bacterium]